MKKVITKCCFLLAFVATMCFSSAYAEPLDPMFDSIVAAEEKQVESEDYYEQLLKAYGAETNEQYQSMQKQLKEYEERRDAAEAKRKSRRLLAFVLSLMIALTPTFVILKRVITGELQPAGSAAIWRTVGMLLGYGIVIFALNYAWLWCLFMGETKIMGAVLGLCLFAFVIYAIHTLRQYHKKNENTNSQKS